MKLSKKTISMFEYLANINQSILVRQGNVLRSRNTSRTAMVKVAVEESFPVEFILYDIKPFLKVLNLFTEPDIEFNDSHMIISQDTAKVRFFYSSPELFPNPPDNVDYTPKDTNWNLDVKLDAAEIQNILKVANVMNFDVISFTQNSIKLFDSKNKESNNFVVGYKNPLNFTGNAPDEFALNFSTDNFKVYDGAYNANFFSGPQTGVKLDNIDDQVTLWLGVLPSSKK